LGKLFLKWKKEFNDTTEFTEVTEKKRKEFTRSKGEKEEARRSFTMIDTAQNLFSTHP
jgi:hypothetical protein